MGILSWWYGAGWRFQARKQRIRLASVADFFSITLLLKSLFAPFRQISAGKVRGPIGLQLRAFADRLVSRVIGAIVRTIIIIIGAVALLLMTVIGLLLLLAWAVVPILPLGGMVLMAIGWLPWT